MGKKESSKVRMPTIVIPFTEKGAPEFNDIFVYLRPETNGILAESVIMKVIRNNDFYKNNIKLVYLANLPGDFIVSRKIIQEHYRVKLYYTSRGKSAFSPYMKKIFEQTFREDFESAKIVGAFDALKLLKMDYRELFDIWVERKNMIVISDQSIKKYRDFYIVNYDIPAILHKNNINTDIAVMLFRSEMSYVDFYGMITKMEIALKDQGILGDRVPISRAFHYSKGPFEQMLDASGYLYNRDGSRIPVSENSFYRFLNKKGLSDIQVETTIRHPVMRFEIAPGFELEDDIKTYTAGDNYEEAYSKLLSSKCQYLFI